MKKLSTSARITEVDTISDKILRLYKADTAVAEDNFLKNLMAELDELSESITIAIQQDKVVSRLDEADSKRDEAIKNLGKILDGYVVIPVQEKKDAAELLVEIFSKYKKTITTANYESESSLIESMLKDFESESAKSAIELLEYISDLISQIRTAQDEFNEVNDEYTAAKISKGASASSYKKPILKLINDKLIKYLEVMQMTVPETYGDLAGKIDEEIITMNEKIAKRAKSSSTDVSE